MKRVIFLATLLWCVPAMAAEKPIAADNDSQRVQTKIGIGGGYPEIIALSVAIGVPNRFEIELSGGAFIKRATGALRVGYPWVIIGKTHPGWWLSLVPKAGLRYTWQGLRNAYGDGACLDGGSRTTRGDEVNALGLNGALSFEAGYIIGKRFGLILQLTAGATWLFAGRNEAVEYTCDTSTDEDIRIAKDNSSWSPDLRASLVFTF